VRGPNPDQVSQGLGAPAGRVRKGTLAGRAPDKRLRPLATLITTGWYRPVPSLQPPTPGIAPSSAGCCGVSRNKVGATRREKTQLRASRRQLAPTVARPWRPGHLPYRRSTLPSRYVSRQKERLIDLPRIWTTTDPIPPIACHLIP